jgi:hypothetical protein
MGKCMINLRENMGKMPKTIYCNKMENVATTLHCATWHTNQPVSYRNTPCIAMFWSYCFPPLKNQASL